MKRETPVGQLAFLVATWTASPPLDWVLSSFLWFLMWI